MKDQRITIDILPGSAGTDLTLGEQLKIARKRVGWTQSDLAERAGIVQHSLYQIERGAASPRPDTLRAILESLGLALVLEIEPAGRQYNGYNDPELRKIIRNERDLRGWSQVKLAQAAQVSEPVVVRIERPGNKPVHWMTVDRLLRALGYTPRYVTIPIEKPSEGGTHETMQNMRPANGQPGSGRARG